MSSSTTPHVVEDCLGIVQLLSDGTVRRSTDYSMVPLLGGVPSGLPVEWKDLVYDAARGLRLRIYRPTGEGTGTGAGEETKTTTTTEKKKKLPVLVYFHGGGFCIASFELINFHAGALRLAAELPALVLSADYRLAPEHRLPAAFDDAESIFAWLRAQADAAGSATEPDPWLAESADMARVFVAGDSAGGTIAHHVAARHASGRLPLGALRQLAGCVLLWPYFGGERPTPSEAACPRDEPLGTALFDQMWRLALPVGATRDHPYANPFAPGSVPFLDLGDGFPPVLVLDPDQDALHDRVAEYVARLKDAGKAVELVVFEGQGHGFFVREPCGEASDELIRVVRRFVHGGRGGAAPLAGEATARRARRRSPRRLASRGRGAGDGRTSTTARDERSRGRPRFLPQSAPPRLDPRAPPLDLRPEASRVDALLSESPSPPSISAAAAPSLRRDWRAGPNVPPPHVVEDCLGMLQLLSDGTVKRAPSPLVLPDDGVSVPSADAPAVRWKDVVYDETRGLSLRMFVPSAGAGDGAGAEKLPVLVYFHGGGFCVGSFADPNFHAFCLRLAAELPAVVLSADYRLAPEHRLPAAFDDAGRLFSWLHDQTAGAGAATDPWLAGSTDFGRVFVSGDSAGANIAHHAAASAAAGDLSSVRLDLAGCVLLYPYFGGEQRTESEAAYPPDGFLNLALFDQMWRLALPAGATRDHPAANPFGPDSPALRAAQLPPLLVAAGDRDLLIDRIRDYVARVKAAGHERTELVEFPGAGHGFLVLDPDGEAAAELVRVVRRFVHGAGAVDQFGA
ncbi:hypothetical protein U9M48_011782 [Paspalum notatum var. saurae]|uniref:Alpha/beta hydrolase fold-3 domain-containing protein n=1 Tax=Paspalum notatum var. saurae TaxID=547442 RepID=A0AAQ3WHV3_PASNO